MVTLERNVGGIDRIARLVLGPILVVVALASLLGPLGLGSAVAGVLLLVGLVLTVTGATRRCPLHSLFGVNTVPEAER